MVGQVYIILIFHYSANKRTARIGIPYFLSVGLKLVDAAPLNLKLSIAPELPVVPVQYKKKFSYLYSSLIPQHYSLTLFISA